MNDSPSEQLAQHVARKVGGLQKRLLSNDPSARGELAVLRRAVTKTAGSVPEAYGSTLSDLPDALVGRTDEPSRAEAIAHSVIALFSVHAQSSSEAVHVPGVGLGEAVRRLAYATGGDSVDGHPILRRFHALMTADSFGETSHHLRGLIQQLKAERIPLDYAQLATDLWFFSQPRSRDSVRLRWSRDLYRTLHTNTRNNDSHTTS
ncbi:type I-E CRISPR-associated protein Cse2/CasB [Corynebacterium breve]|uniref:type I-E CRISPR-associated protein Cse2/CasB n=1 Tax=Corynebacterium breve TaxID=3049799 RepID=UPI003D7A9134